MFKEVHFYTNQLKRLKRFYGNIMELEIIVATDESFTFKVGTSTVTFTQSDQAASYHFAINIPGNQFSMMKYWMMDRVTLNREEGRDEVFFPSFDADSMYFEDPAGNIVELIGRRKRDRFGELTTESFLNVSEVGIVTPLVASVGEELQDMGLPLRGETEVIPDELNFLGKGDAFIVLVPLNRRWYFSKQLSKSFPLEIGLDNGKRIVLNNDGEIEVTRNE